MEQPPAFILVIEPETDQKQEKRTCVKKMKEVSKIGS